MTLGYAVLGFLIGMLLTGGGRYSVAVGVAGAVIGWLFARLVTAERRLEALAVQVRELAQPPATAREAAEAEEVEHIAVGQTLAGSPPQSTDDGRPAVETAAATRGGEPFAARPVSRPAPAEPSLLQRGLTRLAHWFTRGNVPVKVGVILSFIGVAFLLKYAIDRELLALPIEFRLLGVAGGALVMLVLGWRLRGRMPAYGLSLQGGGAGMLFLTIFAAFRIWQLLPAGLAFALLAVLALATGALAVLQSSRTLVVLGTVGGFLAPVLASTGQGSHVALFSYYLVLNAAILGVAWFRAWRELNLVGFFFTFVIGSLWGYRYYRPELLASTEPFLLMHFIFYNAIAILYALRQAPERVGLVDGTLVFGTPVIAFGLQAALMQGTQYGLALSAAALGVFYVGLALTLHRRAGPAQRDYLRLLTESFLALAIAFATLAIPLALDARWTAAAWALEGAALVWIGTRQGRHLASLAGAALVVFAGIAALEHGWRHGAGWPVLNANVLGGLLVSLAALFTARRLEAFDQDSLARLYPVLSWVLFAWGVLWWLGTGLTEIDDRMGMANVLHAGLAFIALTAAAAAWLGKQRSQRQSWRKARQLTLLYLPALTLLALLYQAAAPQHFLYGGGWLAWPLACAVQAWVLRQMDEDGFELAAAWHAGSVLLLTALLSLETAWQTGHLLPGDWDRAAASAVPGFIALLILRGRQQPAWPVPAHPLAYRGLSWVLVAAQLTFLAWVSIERPGDPAPLAYIPLLNPLDLALLYALLVAYVSLRFVQRESGLLTGSDLLAWRGPYQTLLKLVIFILTTAALVRGVHHVSGVPWHFQALFDSDRVQTALSIYWGLLGFAGMIGGARWAQRPAWLAGAGFMGLVVVKLFVVDLGNSGTLERIISFIGIGMLLLVVGYFAPAPPRPPGDTPAAGGAA